MILVKCLKCGEGYLISETAAQYGGTFQCPSCGEIKIVPAPPLVA